MESNTPKYPDPRITTACTHCKKMWVHDPDLVAADVCNCPEAQSARAFPKLPLACPTSLHDQQSDDSLHVIHRCKKCSNQLFVVRRGELECTGCGTPAGMSVVATNVVQELRTANAEKNQGLAQLLELIIELSEQFARTMPLAKPQIDTIVRVSRAKLLELKL